MTRRSLQKIVLNYRQFLVRMSFENLWRFETSIIRGQEVLEICVCRLLVRKSLKSLFKKFSIFGGEVFKKFVQKSTFFFLVRSFTNPQLAFNFRNIWSECPGTIRLRKNYKNSWKIPDFSTVFTFLGQKVVSWNPSSLPYFRYLLRRCILESTRFLIRRSPKNI